MRQGRARSKHARMPRWLAEPCCNDDGPEASELNVMRTCAASVNGAFEFGRCLRIALRATSILVTRGPHACSSYL